MLLAGLLVLANALSFSELAARAPQTSGIYALVRCQTSSTAVTFFVGWAMALGSLGFCVLLAQSAAAHLQRLALISYGFSVEATLMALIVLTITVLAISLRRSTARRRRVSAAAVGLVLLLILSVAVLPLVNADNFQADSQSLGRTITLSLGMFIALELTAGRARELNRRTTKIHTALLLTPVIGAVIAAAITAASIGTAGTQAINDSGTLLAPMGKAAWDPWGEIVVLIVGFSTSVAILPTTLRMAANQLFQMGRDGFLPSWLIQTRRRNRTPVRLLLVTGLLALLAIWIPQAVLGQLSGLLFLVVLMATNSTLVRQPRDTPSPFRLPFHPWIPALVLAVDVLAISLWDTQAILWSCGALAIGTAIFLAYGRTRYQEAQEGLTVFHPPDEKRLETEFCVLVPISNPATATKLLRFASQIAAARGGEVLALQVLVVQEPLPLETVRSRARTERALLEKAVALTDEEGLPIHSMARAARSVAQGVVETASDEEADLIVLGWGGADRSRAGSLGQVTEAILRDAPCDVLILRGDSPYPLKRVLVPSAGGPHSKAAMQVAMLLSESSAAEVTLLNVKTSPAAAQQIEQTRLTLEESLSDLESDRAPGFKVVVAPNVVDGIVKEARDHDIVLLGVSDESLFDRLVFGSVPLQVASRAPAAGLVQAFRGITGLWYRRLLRALRSVLPALNEEERIELRRDLYRGARPGSNYFVLTVLSCVIAALGLLLNSPAVVIGAMLVAPLMSPIMAFSLGLIQGDFRLIRLSAEAIFKGVTIALIIAASIGLLSPFKTATPEMIARTRPTLFDMAVALASGLAGAYAASRKDVSAALPGVAIAAALMPPLATVGLSLATGDLRAAGGAFLLFATNIAAISLAGGLIFGLLGIRPRARDPESRRLLRRSLVASLALLLAIAIPLGIIMGRTLSDIAQEQTVHATLAEHMPDGHHDLVQLEVSHHEQIVTVIATVRTAHPFDQDTADSLARVLADELEQRVQLEIVFLPTLRSEEGTATR
jgi:uncharacterized hydrophobic protein (TIGR00271 family)